MIRSAEGAPAGCMMMLVTMFLFGCTGAESAKEQPLPALGGCGLENNAVLANMETLDAGAAR